MKIKTSIIHPMEEEQLSLYDTLKGCQTPKHFDFKEE